MRGTLHWLSSFISVFRFFSPDFSSASKCFSSAITFADFSAFELAPSRGDSESTLYYDCVHSSANMKPFLNRLSSNLNDALSTGVSPIDFSSYKLFFLARARIHSLSLAWSIQYHNRIGIELLSSKVAGYFYQIMSLILLLNSVKVAFWSICIRGISLS